jgi:cholesterol transport system auxiliary component
MTRNTMKILPGTALLSPIALALLALALCGCSLLKPSTTPQASFYALDNAGAATRLPAPANSIDAALTLIVNPPNAAAGFDSPRIVYVREPHKLDYYAQSQWVDPPARMLGPLLVGALEATGAFRSVVLTPGSAAGDLRLDTEIIRLQQDFQTRPSQVRFSLRATLVDEKTRRVLGSREFDGNVPASGDDTYGGVVAANLAVRTVLENLATFCAETAKSRNDK